MAEDMITKSLARMQVTLLELRMKDLKKADLQIRALHSVLINQGSLLGLVIELLKDRFAGDGADLESIEKLLLNSQALSEEMIRLMERQIGPRDQQEAVIEDFKRAVDSLPDD